MIGLGDNDNRAVSSNNTGVIHSSESVVVVWSTSIL
jgi:hypothetical protein